MAHFCTKCGSPSDSQALFCDNCGAALRAGAAAAAVFTGCAGPSASAAAPAPVRMPSRRTIGLIGGALAIVAVGAAVLVYALAPEAASSASFSRAVNDYLAKDPAANDRLVCAGNLPYQTDPMRIGEYDQRTRQWMELLQQAGVYAAATMESSGGFMPQSQFVYQLTGTGRASVRNNKLCIASGVQATSAAGFEQVQKDGAQSRAMAEATLALKQEAPWLAKSPQRAEILKRLGMETLAVQLPLSLVDKKWQVDTSGRNGGAMRQQRAIDMLGAGASAGAAGPASGPGLFDRLRAMFSFGGHPLVGKWTDSTGMAHFEFTRDSIVQNGVSTAATFKVNGDAVVVSPASGGPGLVIKMRDANHAALDMGFMSINLTRSH